jgi:predicted enzyme related to lactoylglutathione lyase
MLSGERPYTAGDPCNAAWHGKWGQTMARVTGIGGVFFKAQDPDGLQRWYQQHLGIPGGEYVLFRWRDQERPDNEAMTTWAPFAADSTYFAPSQKPYMINYLVDDLDGMLKQLREAGVTVEDRIDEQEFGRFGWCIDPEGTKIEFWEPASGS